MRSVILLLLILPLSLSALTMDYRLKFSESLNVVEARVCFTSQVPRALHNGSWNDRHLFSVSKADGSPLRAAGNKIVLQGVKAGQCINYQASLNKGSHSRRSLYRAGKDLIVDNNVWLWQPTSLGVKDQVVLNFELPQGYSVSTPWPKLGENQYQLTTTPYHWDSRMAIGQFKIQPVRIAGQTLQVVVLNSSAKRRAEYIDWITQAAEAIAGVNGNYPVDNAQVIITPIGAKREAVPWGEVQRGGSVAAHFFVDSFRPIKEFKKDWTAAHELSHMLVPYIDRDELWLSEGMASYYQNVARGKAGMLTKAQAWDKLLAGFGRGLRAAKRETLSQSGSTMQIYWGGAALYLMADDHLRQSTAHLPKAKQQSLAKVLARFNRCCRPSTSAWSGLRLMKKFDQLSESSIFSELYQQAQQRRFMDIKPLLKDMGFNGLKRGKWLGLSERARKIMD